MAKMRAFYFAGNESLVKPRHLGLIGAEFTTARDLNLKATIGLNDLKPQRPATVSSVVDDPR
jgi:hypothetical protein